MEELTACRVFEPTDHKRLELERQLRRAMPSLQVTSFDVLSPRELSDQSPRTIMVLGPGFGPEVWPDILPKLFLNPSFIVLLALENEQSPNLKPGVRSGVHGITFLNASAERMKQALDSAVAAWKNRIDTDQNTVRERIINFPWLLEQLAENLEQIAAEVSGKATVPNEAYSFQVKRAIASAVERLEPELKKTPQ